MLPSLMVRPLLSLSISRSRCAPSSHSLLNPFLATRASHLRCTENRTTSNPQEANVDALDAASSLSPLLGTLTKNTRGGVYLFPPKNLFSSFSRLLARHPSLAPKSFTIRTSGKCTPNPIRMCTSKTNDLKLFRISTSKKQGGGRGWWNSQSWLFSFLRSSLTYSASSPAAPIRPPDTIRHSPRRNLLPCHPLLLHCLWLKVGGAG
jgi:hypothetical protein